MLSSVNALQGYFVKTDSTCGYFKIGHISQWSAWLIQNMYVTSLSAISDKSCLTLDSLTFCNLAMSAGPKDIP